MSYKAGLYPDVDENSKRYVRAEFEKISRDDIKEGSWIGDKDSDDLPDGYDFKPEDSTSTWK